MKFPNATTMKAVMTSPQVKRVMLVIGMALIALFITLWASGSPRLTADAADRERQIEKLRLEQIDIEKKLMTIQADWTIKNQARLDADAILQVKLTELSSVETAGRDLRTQLETKETKITELRNNIGFKLGQ